MASQVDGSDCYKFYSFIRGYHGYKDLWVPKIGEVLLLKWEPENKVDKNAVAVTTSNGTHSLQFSSAFVTVHLMRL